MMRSKPLEKNRIANSLGQEKSNFMKFADIQSVEMQRYNQSVNAAPKCDDTSDVETAAVTVDSGAYHAAGPPRVGAHFPMRPAGSSKAGRYCSAASGSVMRNFGQRVIAGKNDNGATMTMPIQGGSAMQLCAARGNRPRDHDIREERCLPIRH